MYLDTYIIVHMHLLCYIYSCQQPAMLKMVKPEYIVSIACNVCFEVACVVNMVVLNLILQFYYSLIALIQLLCDLIIYQKLVCKHNSKLVGGWGGFESFMKTFTRTIDKDKYTSIIFSSLFFLLTFMLVHFVFWGQTKTTIN